MIKIIMYEIQARRAMLQKISDILATSYNYFDDSKLPSDLYLPFFSYFSNRSFHARIYHLPDKKQAASGGD